jgi:2-polyprenyl-6-methoxyphenol hydroxylase-like FAD-dependent oxidoreductase
MMERRRATCDVLVVGFGVAGVSAAVRAAREGAQTILVERNDFPGGAAVAGMHRFICGLYANGDELPNSTLNGGIAAEIHDRLQQLAPEKQVQRMGRVHVLPFSTRDLVSTLRALSEEERALEILYSTRAVSVEMERDAIVAITAQGQLGELRIAPRAVIDCSGDGIIIQMSGAGCRMPPSAERQLAGYGFRVKGLEDPDELLPLRVPYYLTKAVNEDRMPAHLRFTTYWPGDDPDEGYCRLNLPPLGEDRDAQARDQALRVHRYLSQVLDPFKNSTIAEMSPEVVDREGPRLCGEYTLTADDVLNARRFPDGAVRNAWPIELWDQERGPSYRYLAPGNYHEIPLRCLKAQDISNCWCAGRCISATREALGSTRVIGTCIALGEEAGREAARHL